MPRKRAPFRVFLRGKIAAFIKQKSIYFVMEVIKSFVIEKLFKRMSRDKENKKVFGLALDSENTLNISKGFGSMLTYLRIKLSTHF